MYAIAGLRWGSAYLPYSNVLINSECMSMRLNFWFYLRVKLVATNHFGIKSLEPFNKGINIL